MEYISKYMVKPDDVHAVCNAMSKNGWRVNSAMPLQQNGHTSGIFVLFERALRSSGGPYYDR